MKCMFVRGRSKITFQPHQTLCLPRNMNLVMDPPYIGNVMYNASKVNPEPHQILRRPHNMHLMIDPRQCEMHLPCAFIYNARKQSQPPTSPHIARATKIARGIQVRCLFRHGAVKNSSVNRDFDNSLPTVPTRLQKLKANGSFHRKAPYRILFSHTQCGGELLVNLGAANWESDMKECFLNSMNIGEKNTFLATPKNHLKIPLIFFCNNKQ